MLCLLRRSLRCTDLHIASVVLDMMKRRRLPVDYSMIDSHFQNYCYYSINSVSHLTFLQSMRVLNAFKFLCEECFRSLNRDEHSNTHTQFTGF